MMGVTRMTSQPAQGALPNVSQPSMSGVIGVSVMMASNIAPRARSSPAQLVAEIQRRITTAGRRQRRRQHVAGRRSRSSTSSTFVPQDWASARALPESRGRAARDEMRRSTDAGDDFPPNFRAVPVAARAAPGPDQVGTWVGRRSSTMSTISSTSSPCSPPPADPPAPAAPLGDADAFRARRTRCAESQPRWRSTRLPGPLDLCRNRRSSGCA